jgi:hypothetical protein
VSGFKREGSLGSARGESERSAGELGDRRYDCYFFLC